MVGINVQRDVSGIEGLCVITPQIINANQEFLLKTYDENEYRKEGLGFQFVQENEVFSKKGVLRGMHVNINHPQGKLIRVIKGRIYDVIIDLRKESKTHKKWFGIELSDKNRKQLYIPEGMGHGYLAIEDSTILFKVTTHYIPNDEIGFAWNSSELNIFWPIGEGCIILNEKDRQNRDLSEMIL